MEIAPITRRKFNKKSGINNNLPGTVLSVLEGDGFKSIGLFENGSAGTDSSNAVADGVSLADWFLGMNWSVILSSIPLADKSIMMASSGNNVRKMMGIFKFLVKNQSSTIKTKITASALLNPPRERLIPKSTSPVIAVQISAERESKIAAYTMKKYNELPKLSRRVPMDTKMLKKSRKGNITKAEQPALILVE